MSCKSSCIEKGGKSIDYSRCVVCFDCIGGCKGHGITFSPGITGVKGTKPAATGKNTPEDASRREFLATSAAIALSAPILSAAVPQPEKEKACANAGECINGDTCDFTNQCYTSGSKLPVTPADSTGIEEFNAACTACNLCIVKCPSQVLKPAVTEYGLRGFMQPVMKYRDGHFCNYDCTVCSQVLPHRSHKASDKRRKTHGTNRHSAFLSRKVRGSGKFIRLRRLRRTLPDGSRTHERQPVRRPAHTGSNTRTLRRLRCLRTDMPGKKPLSSMATGCTVKPNYP